MDTSLSAGMENETSLSRVRWLTFFMFMMFALTTDSERTHQCGQYKSAWWGIIEKCFHPVPACAVHDTTSTRSPLLTTP